MGESVPVIIVAALKYISISNNEMGLAVSHLCILPYRTIRNLRRCTVSLYEVPIEIC